MTGKTPALRRSTALLLAGAALLAGSSLLATPAFAQDRGLGLMVQNNINAQLVDPNPDYAGVPVEGGNGQKADTAVSRYRAGRVQPLQNFAGTTAIGSASAGATAGAAPSAGNGPR
ncbi:MAG: hypothetical protein ACOYO0_12110 [Sandarakinorhabdus sp.]|jgi:hypothetical protein